MGIVNIAWGKGNRAYSQSRYLNLVAEAETMVEPDRMTDDFKRKTKTLTVGRTWKAKDEAIIGMLCVMFVGLQSLNVAGADGSRYAKNMSFPSLCAEEDNVNIPIYGGYVSDYQITATFPTYYPLTTGQKDFCIPDRTNCEQAWDMRPTAQIAYYDAGATEAEICLAVTRLQLVSD